MEAASPVAMPELLRTHPGGASRRQRLEGLARELPPAGAVQPPAVTLADLRGGCSG
jgi:hypothetical protein